MKSAFLFLAGIFVGSFLTWFVFSKDYVLLPSGTTLVEVNRFNGSAREVYYSYEEADRLRREEDQRVEKAQEAWDKANTSPAPAEANANPKEEKKKIVPLTAEELAQVKFTARLATDRGPARLSYSIYNGTGKTLVQATVRVEGTRKESDIPLARLVDIPMNIKPSTDGSGESGIEYGYIDLPSIEALKISLSSVLAQ